MLSEFSQYDNTELESKYSHVFTNPATERWTKIAAKMKFYVENAGERNAEFEKKLERLLLCENPNMDAILLAVTNFLAEQKKENHYAVFLVQQIQTVPEFIFYLTCNRRRHGTPASISSMGFSDFTGLLKEVFSPWELLSRKQKTRSSLLNEEKGTASPISQQ